ncbi:hypothetical protein ACFX13_018138 [Malus domestica]
MCLAPSAIAAAVASEVSASFSTFSELFPFDQLGRWVYGCFAATAAHEKLCYDGEWRNWYAVSVCCNSCSGCRRRRRSLLGTPWKPSFYFLFLSSIFLWRGEVAGSVSEMGWLNWVLGLLHFMCSAPAVELSVRGMVA